MANALQAVLYGFSDDAKADNSNLHNGTTLHEL